MSNLRLINESSGSSLSSYSVQDVFSSDYDIYQIEITEFQQTATFSGGMRFINSSGSVISSSDYAWARLSLRSYGSFIDDKSTSDSGLELEDGSKYLLTEPGEFKIASITNDTTLVVTRKHWGGTDNVIWRQ